MVITPGPAGNHEDPRQKKNVQKRLANLLAYYRLGQTVRAWMKKKKDTSIAAACRAVARRRKVDPSHASSAYYFAERYDAQAFRELAQLRLPNGQPLAASHLLKVISFKDKATGLAWLKRAAEHGWSAEQLAEHIQRAKRASSPGSAQGQGVGRGLKRPRTLEQGLDGIALQTTRWVKRWRLLWQPDAEWWQVKAANPREASNLEQRRQEVLRALGDLRRAVTRLEKHIVQTSVLETAPKRKAAKLKARSKD